MVLLPTGAADSLVLPRQNIERYRTAGWARDGKSVVFTGIEHGRLPRTYVQDIRGGAPQPVTSEGVRLVITRRVGSPDGRRFLRIEAGQLRVAGSYADSGRVVVGRSPNERIIGWTANSRGVFLAQADSSIRVVRLDLDSGKRTPWKTISFTDRVGLDLNASNVVITPNGDAYAADYGRWVSNLYLVEGLK